MTKNTKGINDNYFIYLFKDDEEKEQRIRRKGKHIYEWFTHHILVGVAISLPPLFIREKKTCKKKVP